LKLEVESKKTFRTKTDVWLRIRVRCVPKFATAAINAVAHAEKGGHLPSLINDTS
jgi:hypothetical protein